MMPVFHVAICAVVPATARGCGDATPGVIVARVANCLRHCGGGDCLSLGTVRYHPSPDLAGIRVPDRAEDAANLLPGVQPDKADAGIGR
jgi:hypothetical protein